MFLSREIDIKLYNICSVKQILFDKYATYLKTTISQRSLRNLVVLQLLFEFNNFSYSIDIINNIIYTSGPCHEHSNQWQCSIVMCLYLYHVTNTLYYYWREFWSRDTDVQLTYIHFGIILTQFYVNFSRQEHQIDI